MGDSRGGVFHRTMIIFRVVGFIFLIIGISMIGFYSEQTGPNANPISSMMGLSEGTIRKVGVVGLVVAFIGYIGIVH